MSSIEAAREFNIVVAAGGGAGSVMGRGFAEALGHDNGYNLSVVVPTGDSGSKTGEIRRQFGGVAVGDTRKVLAAVSGNDGGEMFDLRFGADADFDTIRQLNEGFLEAISLDERTTKRAASILDEAAELTKQLPKGLRGHTYGNLILTALRLDYEERGVGGIADAAWEAGNWLAARATVIPVTAEPHTVMMNDGGNIVVGEGEIDDYDVQAPADAKVWLENEQGHTPRATRQAYDALAQADRILVGPGSLFTSLLPVELPGGVAQAIAEQHDRGGEIATVLNLVAEKAAMAQMSLKDYLRHLSGPLGRDFDCLVYNTNAAGVSSEQAVINYQEEEIRMAGAIAIGANLVSQAERVQDPNDPIAHLRSTATHRATAVVGALLEHGFLLPVAA
jgi:uncharacterized cofD-like protein